MGGGAPPPQYPKLKPLVVSKFQLTDFNSSLCVLNSVGGRGVVHTFGRQAIPMIWDFMETNPFNQQQVRTVVKPDGPNKYVQEFRDQKTNSLVSTSVREIVGDKLVQVREMTLI